WAIALGDVRPEAPLGEMLARLRGQRGRRDLRKEQADREGREKRDRERGERDRGEAGVRADARRKLVQEEPAQPPAAGRRLAVHERVGGRDEIVQTFGRRVEREVATSHREV